MVVNQKCPSSMVEAHVLHARISQSQTHASPAEGSQRESDVKGLKELLLIKVDNAIVDSPMGSLCRRFQLFKCFQEAHKDGTNKAALLCVPPSAGIQRWTASGHGSSLKTLQLLDVNRPLHFH